LKGRLTLLPSTGNIFFSYGGNLEGHMEGSLSMFSERGGAIGNLDLRNLVHKKKISPYGDDLLSEGRGARRGDEKRGRQCILAARKNLLLARKNSARGSCREVFRERKKKGRKSRGANEKRTTCCC